MHEFHTALLTQVEHYVTRLLQQELEETRYFHNLAHTKYVVANCTRLAFLESCTDSDTELLLTAAWFHDTGYVKGSCDHENESVAIAETFLKSFKLPENFVPQVGDLIRSTKVSRSPSTLLEEILCDADLSHLASIEYWRWELRLKQELEFTDGFSISDDEWTAGNIAFFERHSYYTIHARALWTEQKQKNLSILKNLLGCSR